MHTKKKFLMPLLFTAGLLVGHVHASLIAYEGFSGYTNDLLNGQSTSSTVGFAGGEEWGGDTNTARNFRGAPDDGLSTSGLLTQPGGALAYRDTSFEGEEYTNARLNPASATNQTPDTLYFSFLINSDGYTARATDGTGNDGGMSDHGFRASFLHRSNNRRPLGMGFQSAFDGVAENQKTWIVKSNDGTQNTGIEMGSGTQFVVLQISRPGGSGDNTYNLWINPTAGQPQGAPDWTHTESFGLVVNNNDYGFFGFEMSQNFNQEQEVLVDELRMGTTWDSITPIPEPGTLLLLGFALAWLRFIRRRR